MLSKPARKSSLLTDVFPPRIYCLSVIPFNWECPAVRMPRHYCVAFALPSAEAENNPVNFNRGTFMSYLDLIEQTRQTIGAKQEWSAINAEYRSNAIAKPF